MLPRPVTSSSISSSIKQRYIYRLLTRSRPILVLLLLLSLALNFSQWNTNDRRIPKSYLYTSMNKTSFQATSHLIIVAGHAIWKGCNSSDWENADNWVLHDYQNGNDSVKAFYQHIVRGAEILRADPSAVLLFSGGITRPIHPFQSEAQSYLALAFETNLVPLHLQSRAFTEDYALDSFQNLLFSIMRYHELALAALAATATAADGATAADAAAGTEHEAKTSSSWPEKITVIGFEMKRKRFVELHRTALRWPEARFEYIGVDLADSEKSQRAAQGEMLHGYQPYTRDLYGCTGELALKRISRNPFAKFHPYYTTNPELAPLIDWCPAEGSSAGSVEAQIYTGPLPWD